MAQSSAPNNIVYKKRFQSQEETNLPENLYLTIENNFYAVWVQTYSKMQDARTGKVLEQLANSPVLIGIFTLWEREAAMEFAVDTAKKTLDQIKEMPQFKFSSAEVAQPGRAV